MAISPTFYKLWEFTNKMSFRIVDRVIIHWIPNAGIEYFLHRQVLNFGKGTSHSFHNNTTRVCVWTRRNNYQFFFVEAENQTSDSWKVPLIVASTVVGILVISVLVVLVVMDRLRVRRAILVNKWKIGEDEIKLIRDRSRGLVDRHSSTMTSGASMMSDVSYAWAAQVCWIQLVILKPPCSVFMCVSPFVVVSNDEQASLWKFSIFAVTFQSIKVKNAQVHIFLSPKSIRIW